MATTKQFLDYAGLQAYTTGIQAWANSASQIGYKTILKSADGNSLNLYKKPNAILGTDTPDATVDLGNADAAAQLEALASVIGATWDGTNKKYTIGLDANFEAQTAVAALNELKGQINILNGNDTTAGSVAKAIKDAIDALDVTEFAIAGKDANTNVITIHGISETDGKVAVGTTAANDIAFAPVAATGAAADVTNTAIAGVTKEVSGTPTATTNLQDTLEALKALIDALDTSNAVTVNEVSTDLAAGILKAYQISQGGSLKGTINIPKDFLVKSATIGVVATADNPVAGYAVGDKYIDFVINTADTASGSENAQHLYLNVKDLVDTYTAAQNAEEVQLAISNANEISATIVKVLGSKVIYKPAYTDPEMGAIPEETVADALNNITAIPSASITSLFS